MRYLAALVILLAACNNRQDSPANDTIPTDTSGLRDTTANKPAEPVDAPRIYSNNVFRNVTVEKTAPNTFLIKGQARIFEAVYNWVVEDGHNELKNGYGMTDAGAPEWGNFSFTLEVAKQRPNSVPHLILFEVSAKDGSRKDELPVPLPY